MKIGQKSANPFCPQVNLRSIGRKRFAHLSESLDEIHVDANVPWGEDTLFTLEFRADEGGKYALHTCNNKYLSACGKVSTLPSIDDLLLRGVAAELPAEAREVRV